jgi:hypothetical protein
MMTGTELADRLLKNIDTSLALRSRIPYLDMLKELAQGGASIPTATLNTSSNFGSFDQALREVLTLLNSVNNLFMAAPYTSPLPLTLIHQNLSANLKLLTGIIDQHTSAILMERLETINRSAV